MHHDPMLYLHRMAFFKSGRLPASVIKPVELTEQQREMMQHRIREMHDGDPGRIVMMPDSLTVNQLPEPKLG